MVKRGQIWITDFNPGFGQEIHKKRPSLIVSIDLLNKNLPTVVVIPLSSQIGLLGPEKILLSKHITRLDKDSVVLTPSVRAIDKERLIKKIGTIPQEKMMEVEESLKLVLGMTEI